MRKLGILTAVAALSAGASLLAISPASAFDFGSGPGCSPIEGVDATSLTNGDFFQGVIGTGAVTGSNKNGQPVDDTDGDGLTDSLEECINDALVGFCSTLLNDESANISVVLDATLGHNNNKGQFTVTFDDVSSCGTSQCSDHADNDLDTFADFPADPECVDYDDDDESS